MLSLRGLMRFIFCCAMAACGTLPGVALAQQVIQAELLADVSMIQRGTPFKLGVRVTLAEPWHIYWKNPGDSGLPTTIQFDLPPGFELGDIQYPLPKRFDQPGNIVGFGYEQEVMFIADVRPPGELQQGSSIAIAAQVKFLRCAEICIPGTVKPSLTLAITDATPEPANSQMFDTWLKQMARPETDGSAIDEMVLTRQADLSGNGENIEVIARWKGNIVPPEVQWFPNPNSSILIENLRTETRDNKSVLAMRVIGAPGGEPLELPVLITHLDADGKRAGVETSVRTD